MSVVRDFFGGGGECGTPWVRGEKRGESGDLVGLSIGTIANARIVPFPGTNFRPDTPEHIKTQKTNFLNLIEVLNEVERFRNPILSFPRVHLTFQEGEA